MLHLWCMIRSFRNKGLARLFEAGQSPAIRKDLQTRCLTRLDVLDSAKKLSDVNVPGYHLHKLHVKPVRYSISVNGPWRITFEWRDTDAWLVDLEQYH